MEIEEENIIFMELKYCERCGGLWLRTRGSEEVYCPSCSERMLQTTWWCEKETTLRLAWRMKSALDERRQETFVVSGGHA